MMRPMPSASTAASGAPEESSIRGGTPGALWRAMRPKQWTKNVLVVAVPLAAGKLFMPAVLLDTVGAFVVFCMAASATYLINDSVDAEADRAHPTKRHRPIASGALSVRTAGVAAAVLFIVSLAMSWFINPGLTAVVAAYVITTLSYSLRFKHAPVIELVLLSLGFLLRAIAGGAATETPISSWFLIVAAFGSLFMATGKRASELTDATDALGEQKATTRRVLAGYTPAYLRFVWGLAATVTVSAYCLWAFEIAVDESSIPWAKISIIPFVVAILLYAVDIDSSRAGAPDEVVLADRSLMVVGGLWLATFGLAAMGV